MADRHEEFMYLDPVGVNGYILSETHKLLSGADDCCVFQETDHIMDVYTLRAIIFHLAGPGGLFPTLSS